MNEYLPAKTCKSMNRRLLFTIIVCYFGWKSLRKLTIDSGAVETSLQSPPALVQNIFLFALFPPFCISFDFYYLQFYFAAAFCFSLSFSLSSCLLEQQPRFDYRCRCCCRHYNETRSFLLHCSIIGVQFSFIKDCGPLWRRVCSLKKTSQPTFLRRLEIVGRYLLRQNIFL